MTTRKRLWLGFGVLTALLVLGSLAMMLGLRAFDRMLQAGGLALLVAGALIAVWTSVRIGRAIANAEQTLRVTLASIGDAVITTDANGRVTFMNRVAERLTGWSERDAAGLPLETVFRIVNESSREVAPNPVVKVLATGQTVGLASHTVLIAKDGTEWPIDDSAAPIVAAGNKLTGVVLIFRDIADRNQAQDELRRVAAELSEAGRRKDEFLAMLAHELRNPLAPLSNAMEVLRLVSGNKAPEATALEMMNRQVAHMVRLIDDLLDVSRISKGKIELRREHIDLLPVIEHALQVARPLCESLDQRLSVDLPKPPLCVDADAARLTQVLGNLLNNACKFGQPGGQVWLSVANEGGEAVIRVRDNGIGIAEHQLARVFDMFMQVDASLERVQGGLGLGLTLAKTLVEMHGGTVQANSEGIGHGSEFIVRLPLLAAPQLAPRPAQGPAAPLVSHRILVVDDNRDAAESLALLLELRGHKVHTAHDGLAAVEAAAAWLPDVILLDIGMPRLNGYEAARRIRAQQPGRNVVLVALTGWGQDEDRRRSEEAGFDAHLVKPVDNEALAALLAKLAARQ